MVPPKKVISGEIFKEPLLDVFLTDLEQISFSLFCPKTSSVTERLRERDNSYSTESFPYSALFGPKENQPVRLPPAIRDRQSGRSYEEAVDLRSIGPLITKPTVLYENRRFAAEGATSAGCTASLCRNGVPVTPYGGSKQGLETSPQITLNVKVGDYVHCGDKIGEFFETPLGGRLGKAEQGGVPFEDWQRNYVPVIIGDSGRIITLTKTQLTLQKTQPVLFYSEATSHVRENEWVQRGSPILTLTHQTLVTGDIVQGIPRIEQLFEAVTSSSSALPDDEPLYETLHSQAREIFRRNWSKVPLPTAVRQALEEIQQIIVESIQKVYLSQGVLIADKHIEIIVKQMTSKGQIIDNGNTGFIINEVLPLQKIENANLTTSGKKAVYAPAVVGLTRAALNSDSFVSAASFQETTRVLTRDAVAGKSDFLRGLKEKVVIGDLISAGTGLDLFFLYTLLAENIFDPTCEKMSGLKKPRLNKNDSSIRRL